MRLFSTDDERTALLQRLAGAPNTPEVQSAIRIVEEAIEFADMRLLVTKIYESHGAPNQFEDILTSGWIQHEMRPFAHYIDELYKNIRLQRFKSFYLSEPSDIDDEGYKTI